MAEPKSISEHIGVGDRPDTYTAAWWRQQYLAACYQQNVYAASIRQLEQRCDGLSRMMTQYEESLEQAQAKIGELQERLDRAAKVVQALRQPGQQPAGGGS